MQAVQQWCAVRRPCVRCHSAELLAARQAPRCGSVFARPAVAAEEVQVRGASSSNEGMAYRKRRRLCNIRGGRHAE